MTIGRWRDDRGQALPLALVMLTFFAVLIAAILAFADTSFRATRAVRDQRSVQYGLDGAVEAAIDHYEETGTCLSSPPAVSGVTATVSCDLDLAGGGGDNSNNTPEFAILTLSQDEDEDGMFIGGPSTMTVVGDVHSNNSLDVGNVNRTALEVTGTVTARSCNAPARIFATEARDCASTEVEPDPGEGDARYDPAATEVPSPDPAPLPACSSGDPVTLAPGTYRDARALSDLMNGCNKTFLMEPGNYYFDFTNTNNVNCGGTSGTHQWCLNNGNRNFRVIAGTPDEDEEECDPTEAGVQFMFGGDSRLNVQAGRLFVCAEPSADRQRIAIYGIKDGVVSQEEAILPTGHESIERFQDAGNALTLNDLTSNASLPAQNPGSSAAITLTGYELDIPNGATINDVFLDVRHRETAQMASRIDVLRATITPAGGSPVSRDIPKNLTAALRTDPISIKDILDDPDEFDGISVRFFMQMRNNQAGTAMLDGMRIRVTYTPPGFQAQSGCITEQPYPDTSACPLIRANGNNSTLRVNGTVYAPLAAIDASTPGQASELFRRGIISRNLILQLPESCSQCGTPAIEIPQDLGGAGTTRVLFIAVVDGESSRLSALVEFPAAGPDILNWSFDRGG